jgi:hypothetical protein
MNAVLPMIAKLYPDIFDGKAYPLAAAGKVIVDKIKDHPGHVIKEEAEEFYETLLNAAPSRFRRRRQESADKCIDVIWGHLNIPRIDTVLGSSCITLGLRSSQDVEEKKMLQLLNKYAAERPIQPCFLTNIVPIQLTRNGKTKLNTVVQQTLQ